METPCCRLTNIISSSPSQCTDPYRSTPDPISGPLPTPLYPPLHLSRSISISISISISFFSLPFTFPVRPGCNPSGKSQSRLYLATRKLPLACSCLKPCSWLGNGPRFLTLAFPLLILGSLVAVMVGLVPPRPGMEEASPPPRRPGIPTPGRGGGI